MWARLWRQLICSFILPTSRTAPCNCDGTYPPSASLIAALNHNINRRTPHYITYLASTMLAPTLNQYLAMLMGDDITTMSEFQVANTILADAIKLTHQMIHAPTSRQSTTGGVISSPHVRYSFITKHSTKLACCFCPTLIPYKSGVKMVALMGDTPTSSTVIELDDHAFIATVAVLLTPDQATALDITPAALSVTVLNKDHGIVSPPTVTTLNWADKDINTCKIAFIPKMLAIPPTFDIREGHDLLSPMPSDTNDAASHTYHEPWRSTMAFTFTTVNGKSLQADHPCFDAKEFDNSAGKGYKIFSSHKDSLDDNVYTAYTPIDQTSDLYVPALKAIKSKLHSGLAHECARYAAVAAPPAPSTAATTASPPDTQSTAFFTKLVDALTKTTASPTKPADTTKESERKETVKRAKMSYQMLFCAEVKSDSDPTRITPAVLSEKFEDVLNTNDTTLAQQKFTELWKQVLQSFREDAPAIGHHAKFNTEILTAAFVKVMQRCLFHYQPLSENFLGVDKSMSVLNFLPVNFDNPCLRQLMQSETTRHLDNLHDERDDNRQIKTKQLFIRGEQKTYSHAVQTYANFLSFAHVVLLQPQQSRLYKSVLALFELLIEGDTEQCFLRNERKYPHLVHSLVCDLQQVIGAFYSQMVAKSYAADTHNDKGIILASKCTARAEASVQAIRHAVFTFVGGNHQAYGHPTESWQYFQRSVCPPQHIPTHSQPSILKRQIGFGQPQAEGKKTKPNTPRYNSAQEYKPTTTPTRSQPGSRSNSRPSSRQPSRATSPSGRDIPQEDIDRFKRMGVFECLHEPYPPCAATLKSRGMQRLCHNHCFVNRYCVNRNCAKVHIDRLSDITDSQDRLALQAFVTAHPAVKWTRKSGGATQG